MIIHLQPFGSMKFDLEMMKKLRKHTVTHFQQTTRILILGSSHIGRLEQIQHMSKVAISRGTLYHFRKYVDLNNELIRKFEYLILLDAGNQIEADNVSDVIFQYEKLIDSLHLQFPKLQILTTDQLPRKLKFFNKSAQLISNKISKRNQNHFHLRIFNRFTYRTTRPKWVCQLDEKLFNQDGIHLNENGQHILASILQKINFGRLEGFRISSKDIRSDME